LKGHGSTGDLTPAAAVVSPWAYEYLATILQAKAEMLAFSDTFIVVGVVALLAVIPAAMLSRSQRRARRLAWS
jgi:DHA2 family multidrug resistance protein